MQRRHFAGAVAARLRGFADVTYPDWRALLSRLAREARLIGWRGPLVLDEFPYLAQRSPELPSVVQQWVDHDVRESGLVVAIAGSSQRMMHGLVLDATAPLFGRAREIFNVGPLDVSLLRRAFELWTATSIVETYAAWGGVPRYWELAAESPGPLIDQVERPVLDPHGPLHDEADRLLIEELPPAVDARPILEAVGMGAHRLSEIASRTGIRVTSLAKPLNRLMGMGLLRRDVPFGESEKTGRRSLYKIADPFVRMWFRVVAPHRALLAASTRRHRTDLLRRYWDGLVATAWEELCREKTPFLESSTIARRGGRWGPCFRWWQGRDPEWDMVSLDPEGCLLLGESKWSAQPFSTRQLDSLARSLVARPAPSLAGVRSKMIRALFVPEVRRGAPVVLHGVHVVVGAELLRLR